MAFAAVVAQEVAPIAGSHVFGDLVQAGAEPAARAAARGG
jgi:hypothetical protein